MKSWFRTLGSDISPSLTEGFTERLQGTYSITLYFLVAAVLLWNSGYSNTQIACVCPAHFTQSQVDYANKLCWSKDTYYVPVNANSTKNDPHNIPIMNAGKYSGCIAIGLAVLLLIPKIIWRFTMRKFGTSINSIFELALDSESGDQEDGTANAVSGLLTAWPRSVYVTVVYMVVKLVYVVINLTQIILIEQFLGIRLTEYVTGLISSLKSENAMVSSPRFPEVVLCDYTQRRLGNIYRYTVQCAMPVNELHQRLWILFLFWTVTVTIIGVFSLAKFTLTSLVQKYHVRFVGHRLAVKGYIQNTSDPQVTFFVHSVLGHDGFLILRIMSETVSERLAVQIIGKLWGKWHGTHSKDENVREPISSNQII